MEKKEPSESLPVEPEINWENDLRELIEKYELQIRALKKMINANIHRGVNLEEKKGIKRKNTK